MKIYNNKVYTYLIFHLKYQLTNKPTEIDYTAEILF